MCPHRIWGPNGTGLTPRATGTVCAGEGYEGDRGTIVLLDRSQVPTIPQLQYSLIH